MQALFWCIAIIETVVKVIDDAFEFLVCGIYDKTVDFFFKEDSSPGLPISLPHLLPYYLRANLCRRVVHQEPLDRVDWLKEGF